MNNVTYNFTGYSVVITGAASGMGEATSTMFAKAGASLILSDINESALYNLADRLTQINKSIVWQCCDVTNENQVKELIDLAIKQFGKIDGAYNNAGIMSPLKSTAEMTSEEYDKVLDINLKGIWLCMKYELLQMEKQGFGSIVNVSSIGGLAGVPLRSSYVASKHGVIGLTRSAALEYAAKGIRVNAICPGTMKTPMVEDMIRNNVLDIEATLAVTPAKVFGSAEDIASAALWLCSEGAGYVTGHALAVDGGYTAI